MYRMTGQVATVVLVCALLVNLTPTSIEARRLTGKRETFSKPEEEVVLKAPQISLSQNRDVRETFSKEEEEIVIDASPESDGILDYDEEYADYDEGENDYDEDDENDEIDNVSDEEYRQEERFSEEMEKRQAIKITKWCSSRWTDGIVYYRYSKTKPIRRSYVKTFKTAMKKWSTLTCLQFVDITKDPSKWNQPHVIVQGERKEGCKSMIGKRCELDGQILNLARGCGPLAVIMHELGHSIGLFHEHSRMDRDKYVRIRFDNIPEDHKNEFLKKNTETYGTPYDYLSIMHYTKKTNGKSRRLTTIETVDPLQQSLIGASPEPSHYDLYILEKMYNCSAHCTKRPSCQNDGFVGKACTCVCPHNTFGEHCEHVIDSYFPPVYDECGEQHITKESVIRTQNFPKRHMRVAKCQWYLDPPPGKKVQVTFDRFKLYRHRRCSLDYLYIMQDLYTEGRRICGRTLKGKTVTAENRGLVLFWRTGYRGGKTGFQATVKFIDDNSKKSKPGDKK